MAPIRYTRDGVEMFKFIVQDNVYINRWREIWAPDIDNAQSLCGPDEVAMSEEAWAQYQGYYAEDDDLPFTKYGSQSSYLSDNNWYVRSERPEGWLNAIGEPVAGCLRFS